MTKTVLAVDDNRDFLEIYERMIKRKNHDFVGTTDSLTALDIMRSGRSIDLLISDLNMPNLSGDQLINQSHQLSPATKYLLITARGSEVVDPILEKLRSDGVQVIYLPKSSSLLEISNAVDSQIGE